MLYSHLQLHNDKDAGRKTSLTIFLPLSLFVRFACERVLETEHKLHILTHCYYRHVVSFLFSWCWGLLHRGFPRSPEVGCGFPYHIWSLLSGSLLATASGVSEVPLGRVWPSLPHLVSNSLGVCWQLHRGFPRSPEVGCGLPYHISSLTLWESAGNCLGTPNSTELNNNSTPTRSSTGSLKSNV